MAPPNARRQQLTRWLRLVRLTGRRSRTWAGTKLRGRGATAEERRLLDEQFKIQTAEDVAAELGSMKGAAMKLGQALSYQLEGLPPAAQKSLASLQADVEPMAPSLAEQVIEAELGRHPRSLFLDWSPTPIAAASIGQVHRAVLRNGQEAAVKVQYPGVAEAIESDLANAKWLHRLISVVALKGLNVDELVVELRDRLGEELDYRLEANRQQRFADRYRDHPFIAVPDVVAELSTGRVLTSTWAEGASWSDFIASSTDAERQHVAEAVYRFAQRGIYRVHEFHADPHPGNYRIAADGTLIVLDYGLVKRFTEPEMANLWPIIDPLLASDRTATIARVIEAGFLPTDHGFELDDLWQYLTAPYRPFLVDRFEFSRDFTADTMSRILDVRGPYAPIMNSLTMPPSFLLLDRVVWGMTALLGQLDADNAWRGILAEYRSGAPPSTELGRAEADWASRQM